MTFITKLPYTALTDYNAIIPIVDNAVSMRTTIKTALTPSLLFPIAFIWSGKPAANQIFRKVVGVASTFPANSANTVGYASTSPTANATFTVSKVTTGGTVTSIGTLTFAASNNNTLSFSVQAAVTLAATDSLQLTAPSSQDATLSDFGISFLITPN